MVGLVSRLRHNTDSAHPEIHMYMNLSLWPELVHKIDRSYCFIKCIHINRGLKEIVNTRTLPTEHNNFPIIDNEKMDFKVQPDKESKIFTFKNIHEPPRVPENTKGTTLKKKQA